MIRAADFGTEEPGLIYEAPGASLFLTLRRRNSQYHIHEDTQTYDASHIALSGFINME